LIREYIYNPSFFGHLLVWILAGIVSPILLIPIVFISNAIWFRNENYLEVVLGLFFMTLLSDSRNPSLAFAQTIKPLHLIIIFAFFFFKTRINGIHSKIHVNLGLFLLIGIVCLFNSPIFFESFQKSLSYFLILIVVPNLLIWDWELNKERTVKNLLYFFSFILLIGILARFLPVPLLEAIQEGRLAGAFGNPNGLGIFSFLFLSLVIFVKVYYPNLIPSKVEWFFYFLCAFSVIGSGSRGALLAILGFLFFRFYGYKFGVIGFVVVIGLVLSFDFAVDLIAELANTVGLQEFFRTETLESGSGRIVALEFAWENIQKNYWLGLGIGYGDFLFKENYLSLAIQGHQGGVHNSYLNVWLDTGLFGLLAFIYGWGLAFLKALKQSKFTWAIIVGVFISTNLEVWIVGSLSPWMISFLTLLTLVVYMKPVEAPIPTTLSTHEQAKLAHA
jgi:O-antigen ligase